MLLFFFMLTKYRQILKKKPSNLKNLFDCAFDYPCAILNAVADILTGKHTSLFNGVSPISSNTQAYEIYANQYTERKRTFRLPTGMCLRYIQSYLWKAVPLYSKTIPMF